jgi:hypothetical protein
MVLVVKYPSSQEVNALLFKSLSDPFDPRIVNPFRDHSKVIKIAKQQHISADIYFLKTKTQVGQFLVAFHPVLNLTNLLFTDLALNACPIDPASETKVIKSNTSMHLYEINPYARDAELGSNRFQVSY